MKTTRIIILAALAIVGCAKEPAGSGSQTQPEEISGAFTLKVQTSVPESKTAISDAFETTWVAEDEISVFHAEAGNSEIKSDGAFGFDADNNFSGQIAGSLVVGKTYDWYTFYPHSEEFASPAQIGVTVPASVAAAGAGVSHLTGDYAPLYGKIEEVAADQTPSITMHHLLSVLEVVVHNNTLMPMNVSSITIEAAENIAGNFNVDITSGSPVFTATEGSKSATLTLSTPVTIKASNNAKFYFGIKPFTAAKGSTLKLKVNDDVKSITLAENVTFTGGKIKTLNYNSNGPAFTVNAQGKKVVFSRGNLWFTWKDGSVAWDLEEQQNLTTPSETGADASLNGNHMSHFLWTTTAYEAWQTKRTSTSFDDGARLFAADGRLAEGWTVLSKAEWDYLLNERTVNGGKGAGYSYVSCCQAKNYYIGGALVRGLIIFPDNHTGTRFDKAASGNNNEAGITWQEVNEAGIAYLPAAGLHNTVNNWCSQLKFQGRYNCADVSNGYYNYMIFKDSAAPATAAVTSIGTTGYSIRLVKVIE